MNIKKIVRIHDIQKVLTKAQNKEQSLALSISLSQISIIIFKIRITIYKYAEMNLILDNSIYTIKHRHNTILIKELFNIKILSRNNINSINNLFQVFLNTTNELLFQY